MKKTDTELSPRTYNETSRFSIMIVIVERGNPDVFLRFFFFFPPPVDNKTIIVMVIR